MSSGDIVRVINPQIEGIMQSLSVSADRKYCVSYSNNDQIIICNTISGDVKVMNRYTTAVPAQPPPSAISQNTKNAKGQKEKAKPASSQPAAVDDGANSVFKDYTDTLVGSNTGLNYFVIWSKYFYYVYDKKGRIVKAEKRPFPIIQIEIIENKSVENYGIELEMVRRAEDCRDDEDKDRDYMVLEYVLVIDQSKLPKKKNKESAKELISEADVQNAYVPSANAIDIHSCMILTRDKKKLFACADIGDNIVQCYRNRVEVDRKNPENRRNVWKFHGSLDDNLDNIFSLVLSDDENYMLAVVVWGFKVIPWPFFNMLQKSPVVLRKYRS